MGRWFTKDCVGVMQTWRPKDRFDNRIATVTSPELVKHLKHCRNISSLILMIIPTDFGLIEPLACVARLGITNISRIPITLSSPLLHFT